MILSRQRTTAIRQEVGWLSHSRWKDSQNGDSSGQQSAGRNCHGKTAPGRLSLTARWRNDETCRFWRRLHAPFEFFDHRIQTASGMTPSDDEFSDEILGPPTACGPAASRRLELSGEGLAAHFLILRFQRDSCRLSRPSEMTGIGLCKTK